MKPKDKILTYQQAKELKWFCENVAGVRTDFNKFLDAQVKFEQRIRRLETVCAMIEEFLEQRPVGER